MKTGKWFSALGCAIMVLAVGFFVMACPTDTETEKPGNGPPENGTSPPPPPSPPPSPPSWLPPTGSAGTEAVEGYAEGAFPAPMGWENNPGQWRLVWNDEFAGDTLNPYRWNIDTGTGSQFGLTGWGNNELQYYRKDNVQVRDGYLILEARDDGRGVMNFTSGKVTTGGTRASGTYLGEVFPERFSIPQGFIEARIRSPRGAGFWPAFWTLGTNSNPYGQGGVDAHVGWPSSGEIDIMEIRGHEAGPHMSGSPPQPTGARFMSTIHHGTRYPDRRWFPGASMWFDDRSQPIAVGQHHIDAGRVLRRTPVVLPEGVDLANEFHVYGVRWDENRMDFYFNGVNWVSINLNNLQGGEFANAESFTALTGQFININLAVGGNFLPPAEREPSPDAFAPGAPWEERSLTIDWVRVHERVLDN